MEAMYILLMLVTAVASRNVPAPKLDFVPSPELLESIFNPPVSDRPIDNPFEFTPETDDTIPSGKKNSNVDESKDHTVEVNLKIRIGAECAEDGVSIQENIKLNGNANTTKAGDGSNGKQAKPKQEDVKVTSRFVDRVALGADSCASGMVRVGKTCVPFD